MRRGSAPYACKLEEQKRSRRTRGDVGLERNREHFFKVIERELQKKSSAGRVKFDAHRGLPGPVTMEKLVVRHARRRAAMR